MDFSRCTKQLINMKIIASGFLLLTVFFTSCYFDNAEDLYPSNNCDTANVTYTKVIQPIVQTNCVKSGCHLGVAPTGYDFSTYAALATVANNGKLVKAIEHTGNIPMPQNAAKLDNCTISKIKIWVANGALNN